MQNSIIYMLLALLAGSMIPFQSAMNAGLGKNLQSPYYSALTVFVVAALGLILYLLFTGKSVPEMDKFRSAPAWTYMGGILGGLYILMIVMLAPKLGIGNVTIMVLMGQVVAAAVIDHWGMFGNAIHALNWQRGVGLLLLVAGVYIVKKY